jgi:hypothetical protein
MEMWVMSIDTDYVCYEHVRGFTAIGRHLGCLGFGGAQRALYRIVFTVVTYLGYVAIARIRFTRNTVVSNLT